MNQDTFHPIKFNHQKSHAEKLLDLPKLGKDDTFNFGCKQCGQCCRNREDILLNPLDLFKIAKHLNKSIKDIMDEYCEFYEGSVSRIPIVRIKPREYRQTCPFSDRGRCIIHAQKPAVCALFPLSRISNVQENDFYYVVQPATCGNMNQTQTVRQWLDEFTILDEEDITILWHKKSMELSNILRELYGTHNFNTEDITIILFLTLYFKYDLKQDFRTQFAANCEEALEIAGKLYSVKQEEY